MYSQLLHLLEIILIEEQDVIFQNKNIGPIRDDSSCFKTVPLYTELGNLHRIGKFYNMSCFLCRSEYDISSACTANSIRWWCKETCLKELDGCNYIKVKIVQAI